MDEPLTNEEMVRLSAAGWKIGGGGIIDGVPMVRGIKRDGKGESSVLFTRAEWRKVIAKLPADELSSLRAELARVTAERDRALQTIANYQVDVKRAYETIALLQEQRDFWKDEGMRGFGPESAEECD